MNKRAVGYLALLISLLFPTVPAVAEERGALYLSPPQSTVGVGGSFTISVYLDTGGMGASATEAALSFDPTVLTVTKISTDGSLVGSWPSPPSFSNEAGTISFTGWLAQYYAGPNGLLTTITFTALRAAVADVRFTAGTILGAGTADSNIIGSMRGAAISVEPTQSVPDALPVHVAPSTPPTPPPSPPSLTTPTSVKIGSDLVVRGFADPNSEVRVWFAHGKDLPTSSVVTAGPDGAFMYISDSSVGQGTYRVWAQAESRDGQKSALSNVLTISTAPTTGGFAAAAALADNAAGSTLFYIILIAALVLFVGYRFYRSWFGKR
jgi:hypothetical protein